MTNFPVLLTYDDLTRIADQMGLVVRDAGLLASAANRPATRLFGEDAYPDQVTKAAAVMHSIVAHHPLVDGNKRLGWVSLVLTQDLNGIRLDVADDEAFDLTLRVASGNAGLEEIVAEVNAWLADA